MEHSPTSATATRSELDWGLAPSRPRPGAPLAGDLRVPWVPGSPQPGCEAPGASARGGFRPVPGHSRPVASGLLPGAAGADSDENLEPLRHPSRRRRVENFAIARWLAVLELLTACRC